MYCDCVWEEIDYRNYLLAMGANPDCHCEDCMDARGMFPNACVCGA